MAEESESRAVRRRRRRRAEPLVTRGMLREWMGDRGESALRIGLVVTVVGSMLAIGAVHVGSLLVLAPIALLCGMLAAALVPGARIPPPALIFFGLGVFSLLQALPLPAPMVVRLAPSAADVWERSLRAFGEPGPGWVSLSLDPGASSVEALKWCCYGAVFWGAATLSRIRGESWTLSLAFCTAVLASLVTLAHGAAGEREVFGFYEPSFKVSRWNVGPLLNANNLAGYLNLGAFTGVALFLLEEPPLPRPLIAVGIALCTGMSVLTASRGGVAAIVLGVLVLSIVEGAKSLLQSSRRGQRRSVAAVLAVVLGGGLLFVLGIRASTWKDLLDRDLAKIELAVASRGIVTDHPIFGVGRGAFESVYPAYRPWPGNQVFPYAENFIAQWLSEWGVPVTVLAVCAFLWTLRPTQLGLGSSATARAASLGILVLLVHNLVDLGLELPSVMFLVALVLGTLWGTARRNRVSSSIRPARRLAWVTAPVALAAFMSVVAFGRSPVKVERLRLWAAYKRLSVTSQESLASFRGELRAAMRRHPAEPYFPLLGALAAWQSRKENPIPWLQRVLERDAFPSRAHLVLAEVLHARRANSQALLELRLAVESDPTLYSRTAVLAAKWAPNYDEAMRAVPVGRAGAEAVAVLCQRLADNRPKCIAELLARDPENGVGHELSAREILRAIVDKSPDCVGTGRKACEQRFKTHVNKMRARAPSSALVLDAELLIALDRPSEAEAMLAEGCDAFVDRLTCLRSRVSAALAAGGVDRVAKAVRALTVSACPPDDECARHHGWLVVQFDSRKRWVEAQHHAKLAAELDPTAVRWLGAALAARKAEAVADAVAALDQAERLAESGDHAQREAVKEGIGRERAKVAGLLSGKIP